MTILDRSPWSNKYYPPLEDGFLPSEKLRQLEVEANELFDAYRELYFEGGVSSVYLWDLDNGFAGCFLVKKSKLALILLKIILVEFFNLQRLKVANRSRMVTGIRFT